MPAPIELVIERMVHGGHGLARLGDGRIALLTGVIPGERVLAELVARKGVLFGEAVEIIDSSPDRVPTPAHPGLDYGHVDYVRQLELKREVVRDALTRAVRRAVEVPAVRAAPRRLAYRAAVQPAVAGAGLGYRQPGSSDVVLLDSDPTAVPSVNAAWRTLVAVGAAGHRGLREVAIRGNDDSGRTVVGSDGSLDADHTGQWHGGEALVALIGIGSAAQYLDLAHRLVEAGVAGASFAPYDPRGRFRGGAERLTGRRWLLQAYGELELTIGATSFAQPNPSAAAVLYRELVEWAGSGSHAVELFAGGGAIALHLAPHFETVTALEVDRSAVDRGRRDAERLGIGTVEFVRADARAVAVPRDAEVVVVDPPRAGLAAPLREELAQALLEPHGPAPVPKRLIYVSCDVATWARDVADLEARGLSLQSFEPFDFYPHTHHVEILSLLVPRPASQV